ncbi:MAG: aldehyde dehydrogenase family protein [Cyclobacteriaceae bacterium]|nr:aldehyde dehydrogenase family protein [Cyclobacteriaceae bacterium]
MGPETANLAEKSLKSRFQRLKATSLRLRNEPLSERKARLRKLESWIHSHRDRIRQSIHDDYKKPLLEVDTSEIYPVLAELRHALRHLEEWARPVKIDATLTFVGTRSEIRYEPKGTCLIIAPWNFPFNLCLGPLVSCLAAGNNAIVKPSELTPHTSALVRELVAEVFSEDIAIVVEGGVEVSQQLLELPFDHIFFTGSTAVGKLVMQAAGKNLSSVTLELGGKSPTLIDRTANLNDAAKRIAFGKFFNNGQTCIAPDYLLVEKTVHDRFVGLLKEEVLKLFGESGSVSEQSASYARLATTRQYHRISELVEDALQRGAHAERLGTFNEKVNFMAPVFLTEISPDARIWEEEIFGPVLPIETFESVGEAVEIINNRPKPLALYIFSHDKGFQEHLLRHTSSGTACINECVLQFTHPNLPFGGVNQSGIGKSHGQYGFLAFSNEKPILRQKSGWATPYLLYPPYTNRMKKIVDLLLKWF